MARIPGFEHDEAPGRYKFDMQQYIDQALEELNANIEFAATVKVVDHLRSKGWTVIPPEDPRDV